MIKIRQTRWLSEHNKQLRVVVTTAHHMTGTVITVGSHKHMTQHAVNYCNLGLTTKYEDYTNVFSQQFLLILAANFYFINLLICSITYNTVVANIVVVKAIDINKVVITVCI